jgi:hypothetical protein
MSKILSMTAAAIALSVSLAAIGAAPAIATDYHVYHPWAQASTHTDYTDRACDLPSSTCSNDERIND